VIKDQLTMAELLALPPTFKLEVAGRAWGYGRTKSHEMQRANEFPCKVERQRGSYVVTKAALFDSLGIPAEFLFATDPEFVTQQLAQRAASPGATSDAA
jgi:hypothetical protein